MALRGRIIVDTYRGQIRIRSWPKKQTAAHKAKNANQIRWFAAAREMAKWAAPHEIAETKKAAKGSGLYPGDLQMMAAAGNLIPVIHGEPANYEKWEPRLEPVSLQGAHLPLAANQVISASTNTLAIWGVPHFQTVQFWTAGDPTKIVIPANVVKVNIHLGFFISGTTAGNLTVVILKNAATGAARANQRTSTAAGQSCSTGPIAVTPGDYFTARFNSNIGFTLRKDGSTAFQVEVLETT